MLLDELGRHSLVTMADATGTRGKTCRGFAAMLLILPILAGIADSESLHRSSEGDLILGGMFPIHIFCECVSNWSSQQCHQRLFSKGLFLAEAMVYAVELVNEQGILPFNITLGYDVRDTCNILANTVGNTLLFANQRKRSTSGEAINNQFDANMKMNKSSSLVGVVGAGSSELSLAANNILSYYGIPQVAYASSAASLNDKSRYKTFLRVLPPDTLQAKAIAQLMAHFKWNYISLVSCEGHYAGPLREAFQEEARRLDICLSNDIVFSYRLPSNQDIQRRLQSIKLTNKSRVILLLVSEKDAVEIIKAAITTNLTNHIWIASDSWSNALERFSILRGGLGVSFRYRPVKGFVKYLQNRLKTSIKDSWHEALVKAVRQERLDTTLNSKVPFEAKRFESVFARVDYVMNCVFILGHVIKEFCLELDFSSNSTEEARKEECLDKIHPRALLKLLFNRTIQGFSKTFTIDEHGDPHGSYDFLNMQESAGNLNYVNIGSYDSKTKTLKLNDSLVDFGEGNRRVPQSHCSTVCPRGYYVVRDRAVQCCWQCKICHSGHVSNVTMAASCVDCGDDHVPNSNKSRCVYVPLEYLAWTHPWAVFLCLCSVLCFVVTVFCIVVFIRYRHSPVVRSSCFEISVVLLISIALGFLLPLFELNKPSSDTCKMSAFLFAIIFTVMLSLTLAKINRTVLILNNQWNGSRLFHSRFLLSSPAHFTSVVFLTLIQMCICVVWFFKDSPEAKITKKSPPNPARYLHCTFHESSWFLVSSGFMILLSFLCTFFAFRSRNFPENYNHAKFVSLAMFTFNIVWLTFMGAYYGNTQPGIHHTVIHVCAIIFSNLLLLLFIYGPKVYVIFFKPELNNARTFREMNLQHILGRPETTRNFSLATLTTPRHSNVYLMDFDDGNNKAVQTPHVYTRDVQTQTELEESVHTTSLVQRLLRIGSNRRKGRKRGVAFFKRGYSESDAQKSVQAIASVISPAVSSPQCLYSCGLADKDALRISVINGNNVLPLRKIDEVAVNVSTDSESDDAMTTNAEELECDVQADSASDNDETDVFIDNSDCS